MTKDEILNMPAGIEMDALIADKVMHWNHNHEINECEDGWYSYCMICGYEPRFKDVKLGSCEGYPRYSTNIFEAWKLAEILRASQGHPIEIKGDEWYDGGAWVVRIYDPTGSKVLVSAKDETSGPNRNPPNICLAICRVALLAVLRL
jgi:uncharacterized protein (DUF779 family)